MRAILSVAFWLFFALSCVVLFCVGLVVFLVTFPFDRNGRVQHLYSCCWAMLYFGVNPLWRLRVEARSKLPWRGAAVLVANHESMADIPALFGLFRPFKWVSKQSVFRAPFLGWNMSLNRYIPLKRGDKQSIAKMMALAEAWLDRGVPVMMFPEGTRTTDGELLPFKDGAFRMAIKKGCPVIPVVLTGTGRMLPKHGLVFSQKADCRVRVLDPVDPRPFGDDVAALREHVRGIMIRERDALRASAESRPAADQRGERARA